MIYFYNIPSLLSFKKASIFSKKNTSIFAYSFTFLNGIYRIHVLLLAYNQIEPFKAALGTSSEQLLE
jgi:hypothetical protein